MALRVLLADESTTIRKVMQLALQDYGVEVKSVPVGVDVVPVSRNFKPDIVFVDVLLQKKSGYEVAKDFKQQPDFKNTPVVLMWSGFMELDEAKAADSGADRRLEKPFDAEILRNLISELVPKTRENPVSDYLTFPKLPDFEEEAGLMEPNSLVSSLTKAVASAEASTGDIYSIPEIGENEVYEVPLTGSGEITGAPRSGLNEELPPQAPEDQFAAIPLSSAGTGTPPSQEEGWSHQDLSKFQIQVPNEITSDSMALDQYMIPADDLSMARVESTGEFEEITFARAPAPTPAATPKRQPEAKIPSSKPELDVHEIPTSTTIRVPVQTATTALGSGGPMSAMDQVTAERILREEARAMIEKLAWQIMPEICERIVKEELNKLLKDVERSI